MHPIKSPGVQWLERSQWVTRRLSSWTEAFQSGLFMGLISDKSLQVFDTYPFDETKALDLSAEAELGLEPWERRVVREHLADSSSILIVAAGGGREIVALDELGYDITSVEYGRKLCEATRRMLTLRGCRATIQWRERFEIPRPDETYDVVFVARKFFSHVHDRRRRIELLVNLRHSIRPSGTLVISFYTRQRDTLAFRMQAALANTLRKLRGRRELRVEVGDHIDPESPLYHHHFNEEEVRDELREAGFAILDHRTDWFGWAVARPVLEGEQHQASLPVDHESSETALPFVATH